MYRFLITDYFKYLIFIQLLLAACSPKNESLKQGIVASNDPIKSYSDFYLNQKISEDDFKDWSVKVNSDEDTLFFVKSFVLEKPEQFLYLKEDTVEISFISLQTLKDTITSVDIQLETSKNEKSIPFYPATGLKKELIFEISEMYSSKYGKPSVLDSTTRGTDPYIKIEWDFPSYKIRLFALTRLVFARIVEDSIDNKGLLERIAKNYNQEKNYPVDRETRDYIDFDRETRYYVNITYISKYFESHYLERINMLFNNSDQKDSIREIERIQKLKEKI